MTGQDIDDRAAEAGHRPSQLPPVHESWLPREHPLHRPRHGHRQRGALVAAVIFFLTPAIAALAGVRPAQIENHRLAGFPSITAGWGFFTGLNGWATDNLPLRNAGVQAETALSQALFGELPAYSGIYRQATGGPVGGTASPTTQPDSSTPTDMSQVIQGRDGWLFYADDMTAKCHPVQPLASTIAGLQALRAAVESSGRRFVLVIAPDKSTVYPQYLPASYPDQQCARQASSAFWSQVTNQAGALDLRAGIQALARTAPVYYSQDTHWDDLGALYMLRSVVEAIAPGTTATWHYQRGPTVTGPADLAALSGQTATHTDQTFRLLPDGVTDRTGPPTLDLAQPVISRNPATTGMVTDPVTVLGDSFLLPATRYLPAAFSDVTASYYGSAGSEPALVQSTLVTAKTVVLEVVERNLTGGTTPLLAPQVIAGIRAALANHPMR